MGNNLNDRVLSPIASISGGVYGGNLLSQLKSDMMLQPVFQAMFGADGGRIFIGEAPSYNETIMPMMEFWWGRENFQNSDTLLTGTVRGRIILPARVDASLDSNLQRGIAAAFLRFLGSGKHALFANVRGLTEFGIGSEWIYDRMLSFEGSVAPAIEFTLPFKFDLRLLQVQSQDVDYQDNLDAALIENLVAVGFQITNDNSGTVIVGSKLNG